MKDLMGKALNGKNLLCVFISLMCVIFGGCGKKPQHQRPPVPIKVEKVIQQDVPIFIEAIGNIYPNIDVAIKVQVTGTLLSTHVHEGDEVEVGNLLFTIDPRPYKAALDKAQAMLDKDVAQLNYAQKTLERHKELSEKNYVSPLNYDQLVAAVETGKAQVAMDNADFEAARLNLNYCAIHSPIAGHVGAFSVQPGNIVKIGDPALTSVRQFSPALVFFSIPQKALMEVQKNQCQELFKMEVYLPHATDGVLSGEVYFIDNHLDLSTGTVLLKGRVSNEDEVLWPGEFVKVHLLLRTEPQALLVPLEAVQRGQKGPYLYLVKPDLTTELRLVQTGETVNGYMLVKDGLQADDLVVTEGQLNLRPGAQVMILNQDTSPKKTGHTGSPAAAG